MSIKHGLLALLEHGPMYGYQLRAEFEARTGSTWPLNVGQVYTTLARLDRDGLVRADGHDEEGHVFYALTEEGHAEVTSWFGHPVERDARPRDELAIKLALAVTVPGVVIRDVLQRQRTATMRVLQDYTRLKVTADERGDLAWLLVLDSLLFQTEAEIRWLDHCESRLARYRGPAAARRTATAGNPAAQADRPARRVGP